MPNSTSDLFDHAEHEPLADDRWDTDAAADAIRRIVAGTRERPPLDEAADLSLWTGEAGVLLALHLLGASPNAGDLLAAHSLRPAGDRGLMLGAAGVLLAAWRISPNPLVEQQLLDLIEANASNPAHELFAGSPGTMLAGLHVAERTGGERARRLWQDGADRLLEQFRRDPEFGCRLWIQYRRGRLIRSIGAGHGFASNVRCLLRGGELLGRKRTAELERAAAATAQALCLRRNRLVNWPTAADRYWAAEFPIRVQWCHGAPGMITSLAGLPADPDTDELLTAAGELVWLAGPLRKGPGLCHGTAGNGCAFLALHARTGEALWLDRARAFAMHALGQLAAAPAGESLYTGATGVALYLDACLHGWRGMPAIDAA